MFLSSWFTRKPDRPHRGRTRLGCEQLEDRSVPATFTVRNLKDFGNGSLRQAIDNANQQPGADLIRFADGLQGFIPVSKGPLSITSDLTIQGPGAQVITIGGGYSSRKTGDFRPLEIVSGGSASISGLTISGRGISNAGTLAVSDCILSGNVGTAYSWWTGGAILNRGTATVVNSTLRDNHAFTTGGAIDNWGTMTLRGCTLSGNSVSEWWNGQYWLSDAGGIANSGTLTVNSCTLSGNSAAYLNGGGGGIFNSADGTATVIDSTLSGNRAGYGGGIKNSGTMTVVNSTLSGNQGGGIRTDGTLTVLSCTVTGNTAGYGGGGICFVDIGGALHMRNTIVAGNTGGYSIPDLNGTLTSSGSNLIGNSSGGSGYAPTDLLDVDPHLGPLQDNGGPTWTHALLAGSSAINAGSSALLPADTLDLDGDGNTTEPIPFDQRGPGFARIVGGGLDIGAFEGQ